MVKTTRHSQHGDRQETRTLTATNRCTAFLDWPGLQQVCRVERTVRRRNESHTETAYAITSLSRQRASAQRLEKIWRGHWGIENSSHYVRDVVFGEDGCRVRTGSAPQLLAALRNALIGLLHARRVKNIAAEIRKISWQPLQTAQLLGIPLLQ